MSTNTIFKWTKRIEPKTKWEKGAIKTDMEVLKEDVKENPELYQYLGDCKYKLKEYQDAIFCYKQAIAIDDKNPESKAPDNAPIISAGETKPPTKPKQIEIKIARIFAKNNRASAKIS